MMLISFLEKAQFDFALQFLQRATTLLPGVDWHEEHLEIQVNQPVIGRLLQRIRDKRSVVFPYIKRTTHFWLIMGTTRHELDMTLAQVSRFVVPTYAEFVNENHLPQLKLFKSNGNNIEQLGCVLYPAGYYNWRSPAQYFETILNRLDIWMSLEDEQPSPYKEQRPTYRSLHELFQAAMAAAHWQEAEQCLQEMQQLNLITADNLAFLQIQLLAQQNRWSDIWNRADFTDLARMRMPRAVRAALLTAFHYNLLLPLEVQEQWQVALDIFKQTRPKLGLLLTGRFDLVQTPVIQVFAYQAATEKNIESLTQLSKITTAKEAQKCIAQLQHLEMDAFHTLTTSSSPLQRARLALADLDYDVATKFAKEIAQPIERAIVLMQIAFHTCDIPLAEDALLAYWELPSEEQARLEKQFAFLQPYLQHLQALTNRSNTPSTGHNIQNWIEWFHQAEIDLDNPELKASLERLTAISDDRFWDSEKVKLLSNKLLNLIVDVRFHSARYAQAVLQKLIDIFLQDTNFPREEDAYAYLYETLYLGLLERKEINQRAGFALLRLAEAILGRSPTEREHVCKNLIDWCKAPIPALENWALEAFELLIEYGLAPSQMIGWYREWVSYLLSIPSSRERANLETWLLFGDWIQPGHDLQLKLQQALTNVVQQATDDPVAALNSGYRIGIFSLRVSSAQRVKQLLIGRNADLDVRLCSEKDLSDEAKALAQNSDLVVIVTTCITHAVTYGIGPYLKKDPVYPQSSGSTSIVQAIEKYLFKGQKRNV